MKHVCPKCQKTLENSTSCECGWGLSNVLSHSIDSQSDQSAIDIPIVVDTEKNGTANSNRPIAETLPGDALPLAVDRQLSKAKELIAQQKFQEALACLTRAIADAPGERLPECMSLKGFTLYQLGDLEKAEKACTIAIEGNWEDPNTFAWRAASRGEQNKWRLAFNDLHRACELTAPHSDQYLALMEQYSEVAKEYFHEQTKLPSPPADVFCDRGWMYLRQGGLRKAERDFKLALSIDIDHRWSALGLAKAHHQAGVIQHLEPLLVSAANPNAPIECRRSAYELSARINHEAGMTAATDFDLHQLYRLAGKDYRRKIQSLRLRAELGFPIRSIDTLINILEATPDATMALLVRGECYTEIKSYTHAIKDFTRFLNVHPDHTDAMVGRAKALLGMRRFLFAHQDLDRVLELSPDHYEAVLLQAKTYLAEERLNEALTSCQHATRLETLPEGFAVKAEIYHQLCNFSESFEEYTRAIELARDNDQKAEYLYRRGTSLYELENFEEAYYDFKTSSHLRPHHSGCWVWKAAAGARLEKWNVSINALKSAIDARPAAAESYRKIGRPVAMRAIKHFTRLEKHSPDTPVIYFYRALAHQFLGDHESAVRDFTTASHRDPGNLEILVARAQSLAESEDHELARSDLTKVIRNNPLNHAALYGRAHSLAALGLEPKARADLKKAIDIDPNCAKYHLLLAQLYLRSGQRKKATRAYDRAIVHDPNDANSYHQRAKVYLSMKLFRRAIRDFSTAIELAPRQAITIEQRGQAYLQNNQPELALEDFEAALGLDPCVAKAYRGRASVLVSRGMHEYVLIWLTKALHRFDNDNDLVEILLARGKVFAQMGRWSPATSDFTAVVELMRHDPQILLAARHARALTAVHSGHFENATMDFRKILKLIPQDPSSAKAKERSLAQIEQILEWLGRIEAEPELPWPAILGPPIQLKPPTRPPVIRKGVILDDTSVESVKNVPPFNTWVLRTPEGKEYGPVHFGILRDWLADGRMDIGARLLRADWSNWKRVERLFPDMLPDDDTPEPIFDVPQINPI